MARAHLLETQRLAAAARLALCGAALMGTVACGGETGERPSASQLTGQGGAGAVPTDPCDADAGYEFMVLKDFEDGRARSYWFSVDSTPEAITEPPGAYPYVSLTRANAIDGGRCGESSFGLHLKASNLAIYGGSFGTTFGNGINGEEGIAQALDASEWDGFSFWVLREGSSGSSLFVGLNTQHTDEQGARAASPNATPFCLDNDLLERNKCDRFGAGVPLTEEWRFVAVRFDQMAQRGYGVVAPYLDVAHIQGLNIGFEVGDWNFWVDDLALFRTPAP